MCEGKIHSIESMGLVDGPGIRTVIFMQGCNLRCRYCHNPDTWAISNNDAETFTSKALIKKISRFKSYFMRSGGGVTFSGGEPLLQPEFLEDMLKKCKEENIHTCIDTAGVGIGNYEKILKYTDLIIFDVKHYDKDAYHKLTGRNMAEVEIFLEALSKTKIPLWVRHVIVPNLTDNKEHIEKLKDYIDKIPNVEKVQLLPYHKLGCEKYKKMGIPYVLEGTPEMQIDITEKLEKEFFHKEEI